MAYFNTDAYPTTFFLSLAATTYPSVGLCDTVEPKLTLIKKLSIMVGNF